MEKKELTSKNYWESYYKSNHANKQHIVNVCSYYDAFWNDFFGTNSKDKTLIEIGGFPGRYLGYLASKYHVKPSCLDYNSDISQIEATFKVMNIDSYDVLQEDFTTYSTDKQYDFVLSNGFIEHFDNFNQILDLHISYLKKGGRLLVMIPNMKGYIRFYKYLVDYKNLKVHNLKCMSLSVFEEFANRNDLQIKHLSYLGDFPHNPHQQLNKLQLLWVKAHRLIFKKYGNKFVNRYPTKYFSSTILGIFEKN